MKVADAILKGILKSTIKVDFDVIGDSRTDGAVTGTVPTIPTKLLKSFKELDNCVLIFDDLERCSLPILNILGYINQFVENDGLKVIMLANEEEIFKLETVDTPADKSYRLIKEKLIGRSFDISSDVNAAISDFIGQLQKQEVKELFNKHIGLIIGVYEMASYQNLRHLRQAILDFERFHALLPSDCFAKETLLQILLQTFFALSIELKKGNLKEGEITKLFGPTPTENSIREIKQKYPTFNWFDKIIDPKNWTEYFQKGVASSDSLKKDIYESFYYQDDRTPKWVKLISFLYLTQVDFDQLFDTVNSDFQQLKIRDVDELIGVVDLFFLLSSKKIIDLSEASISQTAQDNIKALDQEGILRDVAESDYLLQRNQRIVWYGRAESDSVLA